MIAIISLLWRMLLPTLHLQVGRDVVVATRDRIISPSTSLKCEAEEGTIRREARSAATEVLDRIRKGEKLDVASLGEVVEGLTSLGEASLLAGLTSLGEGPIQDEVWRCGLGIFHHISFLSGL